MSQKIVIKANVKREPEQKTPEISYEWHWRRIFAIGILVIMTSAAAIYGLTISVNADQGEQSNEQARFLSVQSTTVDENKNQLQTDSSNVDSLATEDFINADSVVKTDNPKKNSESLSTESHESVREHETVAANLDIKAHKDINEPDKSVTEPNNQAAVHVTNDQGSQSNTTEFAQNARVANVALGAQIDTDKISRAVLTRAVKKREPTNVFASDVRLGQFKDTLSFFSELKGLQGQQITHAWYFEGESMAQIVLDVTSSKYRTYSTKSITNTQIGRWRVDVIDGQGNLIAQKEFRVLAD